MSRAQESSGWQEGQPGGAGQRAGATDTGPGTTTGAAATGRSEEQYRTHEGRAQPSSAYGRTGQHGGYGQRGYGPTAMETYENTVHGGVFLLLAGLLTFLVGLAFVVRNGFYHGFTGYAYNWGIVSWGWVLFGLGIATFAVGASHLLGIPLSRPVGMTMAMATAVAGFMIIPFYPLWAIIIVALGLAALWGLAHGAQSKAHERELRDYAREREMM